MNTDGLEGARLNWAGVRLEWAEWSGLNHNEPAEDGLD